MDVGKYLWSSDGIGLYESLARAIAMVATGIIVFPACA
jgi:hypothetical protein